MSNVDVAPTRFKALNSATVRVYALSRQTASQLAAEVGPVRIRAATAAPIALRGGVNTVNAAEREAGGVHIRGYGFVNTWPARALFAKS